MYGVVAIVGRPNVGKSTLFNRMTEGGTAIVEDIPGVTRDRNIGVSIWNGKSFTVLDTGGYLTEHSGDIETQIRAQVELAVKEADVVLFVVDVKDGLNYDDHAIADVIRRMNVHHVGLVINKVDNAYRDLLSGEFYALGIERTFNISSINGSGTGEVMDFITENLPNDPQEEPDEIPRIAIVGRPNVGKSSLVNALMGKNQNIVSEVAGTTRDAVMSRYNYFGFDYWLVDTAGIRKRAKVEENLEFYSVLRSVRAIEKCDVALLMISAETGIEAQDLSILHLIEKHRKGIIILVNKWDLTERSPKVEKEFVQDITKRISPLSGVPILFISATEKLRIFKAMEMVTKVHKEITKHIPTHQLNDVMLPIIENTPPPSKRGIVVRIKHVTQVLSHTPTFVFFANHPKMVGETYRRFLENQIRKHFGFEGCPVSIRIRPKS